MRIGIDGRCLSLTRPAGIATYLREILKYIQVIDNYNEYIIYSNKEFDDGIILSPNFQKKVIPGKIGTFWLRYTIPQYCKKDAIDVFWGPEHVLPLKDNGTKYILTVHDLALLINPSWGQWYNLVIQNLFLIRSVKTADRIIAISNSTKQDIINICKVSGENIEVVYNGATSDRREIDEKDIEATLRKYNIDKQYFLYVGTIEPRKNITAIIKSFELVNKNHDSILVLAGGLGWKYKKILRTLEESQCKDDIRITGYVSNEEKEALYKNALAFVFPSHYEGFGLPIIEAMVRGTPVITARNSSLQELGGDVAFYVDDENDIMAIKDQMNFCKSLSRADREKIAHRSVENANRFTWEKCATETHALIVMEGKEEKEN